MQKQIVLDSNIWIGERMLKQGGGSAFRLYLMQQNARLIVPEIVRLEVRYKLYASLRKLVADIQQSHKHLLTYAGTLKELSLPTDSEIEQIVDMAFDNVGVEIGYVPFTIDSARSALEKCLRHEQPSSENNEQFRDAVIWADCLRLAQVAPVIFVTGDSAFYKNRKPGTELAENLAKEAGATEFGVVVHSGFEKVLEELRQPVNIDFDHLEVQFRPLVLESTRTALANHEFELGARTSQVSTLYATVSPARVFVKFEMAFECNHPAGLIGQLNVRGDGDYLHVDRSFENLRVLGADLVFIDLDGKEHVATTHFAFLETVFGQRTVQHQVRYPL